MGLRSFFSKQFVDVIQWTESEPGVLAYRYPMQDMEIQNGASLTVRDSQMAMFADEGKVADVFGPGRYTLATQTLPIPTYLKNWDKFFESPFKSDVYFFSMREQIDRKWGTPTPITIRDKEFGALRIRANGIYSFRLKELEPFWTKLSGTVEKYRVEDAEGQLRAAILTAMATFLGGSSVAFIDMAANQTAFSDQLKDVVRPAFEAYGLELTNFYPQSLSLPEELQQYMDKATSMRMVGDLQRYAHFQAADSLSAAAENPGGLAGAGVGLGAGMAMGQVMTSALSGMAAGGAAAAGATDPVAMLEKLGELLQKGILTQAEFDAKKTEILQQIRQASMQTLPCPSCGGSLVFQSSIAVYAVCPYCRSMVVRKDKDIASIGIMAQLPDDISPFQIGSEGVWEGVRFGLIGRVKVGWAEGAWNEWFVYTDEGRKGWLAEAQGFLALNFEEEIREDNTREEEKLASALTHQPSLGNRLNIRGKNYSVVDLKEAEYLGGEGELPFPVVKGKKILYADLLGKEGAFGGIEYPLYTEIHGIKPAPRLYLGQYVEFSALRFSHLRELEGWSPPSLGEVYDGV